MPQEHRLKATTQKLIIKLLAESDEPLTRTDIARGLNRSKTPHLINLIDKMVDEGLLVKGVKTFHNGVQGYVYSARPSSEQDSK